MGMYRKTTSWMPTHLWLLLEVRGREVVGYTEAALIRMLRDEFPLNQSINWINRDAGGSNDDGAWRVAKAQFKAFLADAKALQAF